MRNTYAATRRPRAYVTGGQVARADAIDQCDGAWLHAQIGDALDCGGPLDAPEIMPAGQVYASHGVLFHAQVARWDL